MTQKESDFENLPPTIQSGAAALDDAWREKIPLVLGNYERLEELGGGGFGVVFKVRHTGLHWERAMKVLDPRIAQEPGERERFLREARVLAGLRYVPEVVRIDDISPAESAWNWLVMELVPGRRMPDQYTAISAAHWLAWHLRHVGDERGLPEAEVLRIFKDVLAALTAAHEMGIVHRDIKPGNILLLPEGGAKLSDFGLVKVLEGKVKQQELDGKSSHLLNLPQSRNYMGTAQYMSPEQEDGKPLDARSDIYSLGLVIYELLVGHRAKGRFKLPHEKGLGVAKFWDEVLDRMIEPRPADRPGSAAEVAAMFPGSVAGAAVASTDDARQRVAAQVEASGLIQEEAARSVDVMHQTEQPRLQRAALLQSTRVAEMQDLATRQAQQAAAESKRAALEQIQRNSAELEKQIPNRKANVTRIPERQLSSSSAYSSDEGATKTYPLRRIAWIVAVLSLIAFFATCGLMNSFGAQDALVYIVAHSLPLVVSGRMYDNSFRWGISSLLASFFLSWPGFCIVYVFHWLSDSSIDSRL